MRLIWKRETGEDTPRCPPQRSGDTPMTDVIEALDMVVLTTDLPAYQLASW
jgi:hypothetical protein